jgi:hypothetical protein
VARRRRRDRWPHAGDGGPRSSDGRGLAARPPGRRSQRPGRRAGPARRRWWPPGRLRERGAPRPVGHHRRSGASTDARRGAADSRPAPSRCSSRGAR